MNNLSIRTKTDYRSYHRWHRRTKIRSLAALFLVSAALLLCNTGIFAAVPADVSPSHWSWDSIKSLAGRNIMGNFRDGTFRGDVEPSALATVTILGRVLDQFEEMEAAGVAVPEADFREVHDIISEFRAEAYYVLRDTEALEQELETLKKRVAELNAQHQRHRSPVQSLVDEMADYRAYPSDVWSFERDEQTGQAALPHDRVLKLVPGEDPHISIEYMAQYGKRIYGEASGLMNITNSRYPTRTFIEQQFGLNMDFAVDEGVTAHLGLVYDWNEYGAGPGVSGNHTGALSVKYGFVDIARPFEYVDGVRIGRQRMTLANNLLFHPTGLDGIRGWRQVDGHLKLDGMAAVYGDVTPGEGLNLLLGSVSWVKDDHLFTFYAASRNNNRNLYNPAGSAFDLFFHSHTGPEYAEDGHIVKYDTNYSNSYFSAWERARNAYYIGLAARGEVLPGLVYHGEFASTHWKQNILDPFRPVDPGYLAPQYGGLAGLNWKAAEKLNLKMSVRRHDRHFAPLLSGNRHFDNRMGLWESDFENSRETAWEMLGYTRNFTDLFARMEYRPGKREMMWISWEQIRDHRIRNASELADDTTVKSAGLRRWYNPDTYLELSWHLFEAAIDIENLEPGQVPVGATARNTGMPDYNLHIGRIPGAGNNPAGRETDQSLLRLRLGTRFD